MGGLATLCIAKAHPDVFSQIALLTPFLRVDGKPLFDSPGADMAWLKGIRVWLDMGPSPAKYYPGDDPMGDARAFVNFLEASGLKRDIEFRFVEVSDGEHTEASWQVRVPQVLLFLYGNKESP